MKTIVGAHTETTAKQSSCRNCGSGLVISLIVLSAMIVAAGLSVG